LRLVLNQNPSKVYCVEPSKNLLKTLETNCSKRGNVSPIIPVNYGIVKDIGEKINIFGNDTNFEEITFKNLIEKYSIDYINYLKIDCEGGEYNIFTDENIDFLINHVEFISMEVHLNYDECREKFKHFRDHYLTRFNNYKVMSCTRQNIEWGKSLDIKDRIFDDNFIDNYTCEFMIYIHNKEDIPLKKNVKYEKSKYNNFKYKFPGLENIERSNGQALQDMFILSILN
jgi:FkbM family methyltransferase